MELFHEILQQLPKVLWGISWQVTVLFVLIGIISLFCRKSSPHFRYWLWCIVLLRLIIPINLSFPVGIGNDVGNLITTLPSYVIEEPKYTPLARFAEFRLHLPYSSANTIEISSAQTTAKTNRTISDSGLPLVSILSLLWFGLAIAMTGIILIRIRKIRRMLKSSWAVERPELIQLLDKLQGELHISRDVRLRSLELEQTMGPAIIGIFKPVVYLPSNIVQTWELRDLEPVLLHELTHIKRRDVLINWIQTIVQVVYFFHPVVWYVNEKIRNFREDACDDTAIDHIGAARAEYAERMLRIVKESAGDMAPAFLAIGFAEKKSSLAKRIVRIMSDKYRNFPGLTRFSIASLIILALVSIVLASGKSINNKIMNADSAFEKSSSSEENVVYLKYHSKGKTFEEIVSIAKAKNKIALLYIEDFKAGCCSPYLRKNVFENERIIARLESTFVIFWIESEQDWKSGPGLTNKYGVDAIPTLVFINQEGKLLNKLVGSGGTDDEYIKRLYKSAGVSQTDLKTAYESNPANMETALKYAEALYKSQDAENSLKIYNKFLNRITVDSVAAKVIVNMSEGYRLSFNSENAIKILEQGLEKRVFHDEIDAIYCRLGNLFCDYGIALKPIESEDYVNALKYYQMIPSNAQDFKTYNKSPEEKKIIDWLFSDAQVNMPIAYLKTGNKQIGEGFIKRLLINAYEKKNYYELIFVLRRCVHHDVYLEDALTWGEKAYHQTEGKDEGVNLVYSELLRKCGRYDRAIELQKKQIESAKNENFKNMLLTGLAVLYFQTGKNEMGEAIFKKRFNEIQNNIDELVILAYNCNEYNVNLQQALNWAKRAIELSANEKYAKESGWFRSRPGNPYNLYAELLFKTGQVQEAIKAGNKAVEIARLEDDRREYRKNLEKFKAALN